MNAWPFVIAAYIVTLGGAGIIIAWSWASMVRAERSVDELPRR